jgi:hypothetical protein
VHKCPDKRAIFFQFPAAEQPIFNAAIARQKITIQQLIKAAA